MVVCLMWHPSVPGDRRKTSSTMEAERRTLLTAQADGSLRIWEYRDEPDDEEEDERKDASSVEPKTPFQPKTIANLFLAPNDVDALTNWDRAYLKALYAGVGGALNRSIQITRMASYVKQH